MNSIAAFFNHARSKIVTLGGKQTFKWSSPWVLLSVVKASLPLHRTTGLLVLWFPKGQGRGDGTGTAVELNPWCVGSCFDMFAFWGPVHLQSRGSKIHFMVQTWCNGPLESNVVSRHLPTWPCPNMWYFKIHWLSSLFPSKQTWGRMASTSFRRVSSRRWWCHPPSAGPSRCHKPLPPLGRRVRLHTLIRRCASYLGNAL